MINNNFIDIMKSIFDQKQSWSKCFFLRVESEKCLFVFRVVATKYGVFSIKNYL